MEKNIEEQFNNTQHQHKQKQHSEKIQPDKEEETKEKSTVNPETNKERVNNTEKDSKIRPRRNILTLEIYKESMQSRKPKKLEEVRGSKEAAFIYAVTSAGVVHAVTQACSSGNLTDCSCDTSRHGQTTPQGWKWGGCSDNLQYGIQFTRKFVDAIEYEPDTTLVKAKSKWGVRMKMNLHNNEAGRQVVSSLMRMQCRCHGISGSCELKTCWKTMPSFTEIGDSLKRKYRQAVQVTAKKKKRLRRKSGRFPVGKGDLVHIHKSPNFCVNDSKRGILGTSGRECNKTSHGPDSCGLLCCGRGYNTQVVKHVERCRCKFVWCCYVKCKICETYTDHHTCK